MRLKWRHLSGFLVLSLLFVLLFCAWKKEHRSHQKSITSPIIETHNNNEKNNETYQLSYHPDIDIRGQWQRNQMNKFCDQYGLGNITNTLNIKQPLKNEFYRHIIVDDKSRNLYCFMPKVGCKTARTVFLVSIGKLPKTVLHYWTRPPSLDAQLEKGIKKSSFMSHSLTDESRITMIKDYGKHIMIRHPLQRLLSAFIDKLSGPLLHVIQPYNYFEHLKHTILKELQPNEYDHWNRNITTDLRVEFNVFIMWIMEQNLEYINEHFAPQYYNSQPCRVRYDFYGNFNQFEQDFTKILTKFEIDPSSIFSMILPSKTTTVRNVDLFYSMLSRDLKHLLHKKYLIDLDFYHYLYPAEVSITKQLLDL